MKKIKSTVLLFVLLVSVSVPTPLVIAWELERPGGFIPIEEREMNATTNGKASVGLGAHIHTYYENDGMFDYNDAVGLRIVATGNSRKILEYEFSSSQYHWYDTFIVEQWTCLGDEEILYIDLPFKVRFYGGPGSAEYTEVWVT